jgi:hypothetical protein
MPNDDEYLLVESASTAAASTPSFGGARRQQTTAIAIVAIRESDPRVLDEIALALRSRSSDWPQSHEGTLADEKVFAWATVLRGLKDWVASNKLPINIEPAWNQDGPAIEFSYEKLNQAQELGLYSEIAKLSLGAGGNGPAITRSIGGIDESRP